MSPSAGTSDGGDPDALARLEQIDHIVVLMKENRSFDQMLGYLMRDGMEEVNGLTGEEVNFVGEGEEREEYRVFEWDPDQTVFHPAIDSSGKVLDPCHSKECVAAQLAGKNGGFVSDFLKTRKIDGKPVTLPPELRKVPMGYYTARHLPVYDHLARAFCVCDAWHSSIPGDTWPNRLFALAGYEADKVGYKRGIWGSILAALRGLPPVKGLRDAPVYEVEAFTRQLDPRQWRWYSQDPATLRAADKEYRSIRGLNRDNFAYFDRNGLSWDEEVLDAALDTRSSFLDDCANGKLRDVSWIDPNFADLHVLHTNSNDDHPPADVKAGQDLVLEVYEALAASPNWENTLLVIVYDEHGGFYDHVVPPPAPPGSHYRTLGVRVPALLIGPRVPHSVCHEVFEHTSLISTILRRFAADPDAAIARMPSRVQHAPHLGIALGDEPRRDLLTTGELRKRMDSWRIEARDARRARTGPSHAGEGAGRPTVLHDFQEEFLKFALAMRDTGLPGGQP
jgi:phospholipase C